MQCGDQIWRILEIEFDREREREGQAAKSRE